MKHSSSLRNFAIGAALSALTIGAVAAQDATPEATPETTPAAQAGSTTDQAQPRPYLGVQISNTPDGITVVDVMRGSAAADAGLLPGDIITRFNDETVADAQALSSAIGALQPSDAVTLEVTRGTVTITAEATLGTAPQRPGGGQGQPGRNGDGQGQPGGNGGGQGQPGGNGGGQGQNGRNGGQMMPFGMGGFFLQNGRLGVAFITLDAQSAQENNVEQTDGALVTEVQENSPAQAAGLQVDDVITAVNGEPVDAERTLRDRLIAYEPGDTVTLTIERAGAEQQIEATLGQPEISEGMMPGLRFMMPDGMMPNGMMPNGRLPDATPEMPATGNANA